MFLQHKPTGVLIELTDLSDLYDPCRTELAGRSHAGEELQDLAIYPKSDLIFPSGEALPACWIDPHYRDAKPSKMMAGIA